MLRNLTPQIDGSTLRTLCLQHGPVRMFHLLLQNGFCLVAYSTQEEALKAQSTLNNCVLGNTTILSHVPSDAEVKQLLSQVSPSCTWAASATTHSNGGGSYRPGSGLGFGSNGKGASEWSGAGLWNYGGGAGGGGSGAGAGAWDERSGSGLQSNLEDLLGGESN